MLALDSDNQTLKHITHTRAFLGCVLLASVTLMACSDDDPGKPGGSGGEDSTESGGAGSSGAA